MDVKPATTQLSGLLRRPLLWAVLGSVVLHLPLLAWFSPGRLQATTEPQTDSLLVMLLADAESAPEPGPEPEPEPDERQPARLQSESGPAPAVLADLKPLVTPAPEVVPVEVSGPTPAIQSTQPSSATLATSVGPAPALHLSATTQARSEIATVPTVMPMAEREVAEIQEALETLLHEFNEPGKLAGLWSTFQLPAWQPAAELMDLPASDSVAFSVVSGHDLNALQQVDIILKREIDGQVFQMSARFQERALSHYAKFVNRWDNNVMLSNDRIDGRFHANSAVNFEISGAARPQFNGEVTIAGRQSVARRLRQSAMFAHGLRTGIGRISLPDDTLPAHWLDTGARKLTLVSDARLEFQGNNGLVWTDIRTNTKGHMSVPEAGLIVEGAGRARFDVSGTVAGRVVVYSREQLMITGDLVYANHSAESADSLSLISDGSIEVAPASVTGPGDLTIQGALYARQRFSVRRFRDSYQGTLHIYGTLVAGSVSATEPRFDTRIEYDRRFNQSRPPAFPSTGLFDLMTWDQQWTVATDSDALLADAADTVPIAEP